MLQHLDSFIAFAVVMVGVSLLITMLTQMVSAFLGLRGTNLRWGIAILLKSIDPDLSKHAKTISEKVLHHPLISDSTMSKFEFGLVKRWKLASAIRVDELKDILRLFAKQPDDAKEAADYTWEEALGKSLAKTDAAPEKLGEFERWFDSTMDRVSQRFAVSMRIVTVICSILVAFALHLDTLKLLTQLSMDAEMRASLVTNATALTRQADNILGTTRSPVPGVYVEAMKQLEARNHEVLANLPEPPAFESREDGEAWLRLQIVDPVQSEAWVKKYRDLVQSSLANSIDQLKDQAVSIRSDLNHTKFQLVPDPFPTPWYDFLLHWPQNRGFWGILASAALLSLGAPFWFNSLKTLTSLRPILATKQDQESGQSSS